MSQYVLEYGENDPTIPTLEGKQHFYRVGGEDTLDAGAAGWQRSAVEEAFKRMRRRLEIGGTDAGDDLRAAFKK